MEFNHLSACLFLAVTLAVEVSADRLGDTCSKSSKWSGICINIQDCSALLALSKKPEQYLAVLREAICGFTGRTPLVCCPARVATTTRTPLKPVPSGPMQDTSRHRNIRLLPMETCGPIADSRIFGGDEANVLEYPWMALLGYLVRGNVHFGCGGSVINDNYVLTAAHCVSNLRFGYVLTTVRLGEHDLDKVQDCDEITEYCAPPPLNFAVEETVPHPQYSNKKLKNDIALVRIKGRIVFSQTPVRAICLPVGNRHQFRNLDEEYMIAAGWGQTEKGVASKILLKVAVPVVPTPQCSVVYANRSEIGPSQLCAGGQKGHDSCGGDSGGPLILPGLVGVEQKSIQYGVVSFGPKPCGMDGKPGVYTRVGYYMGWILDNLRP